MDFARYDLRDKIYLKQSPILNFSLCDMMSQIKSFQTAKLGSLKYLAAAMRAVNPPTDHPRRENLWNPRLFIILTAISASC